MPPDPILAVLAFAALILYCAIGAVVATFAVRFWEYMGWGYGGENHGYMRGIAGQPGGYEDGWIGMGIATILWPAIVAIAFVFSVMAIVALCPVIVVKYVGRYVAKAQLGRK